VVDLAPTPPATKPLVGPQSCRDKLGGARSRTKTAVRTEFGL